MKTNLSLFVLIVALAGCTATKPLKPGTSAITSGMGTNGVPQFKSEMKQPENPAQSAAQTYERTTETELPLASGTKVTETVVSRDERWQPVTREKSIALTEPTIQKTRVTEKAGTIVGAAQQDTAREIGAKLSSLKGIVWLGAALFVFGLASLVWPPLRAIIGSVTTSVALSAGGIALMVLPSLVVGNEMVILGGVGLFVGAWFLAHRHGCLRGEVERSRATAAAPARDGINASG